ncbi:MULTISPECIES: phage tail protein [Streptomyces]|uniref:Phage tail protein n=1 Tax=Streptomyces beijiangensis TaxID=163361 RepID=A0A939FEP9_9ACTN|nr:phage tail protein [Streptomyces beijiangensis]MBO0516959.1 phage tail protein [Streptomyces beijiangensis]
MALKPGDSLTTNNFGIQIDGVMVEYLQEVSSLVVEQDVIESKQVTSSGKHVIAKLPGAQKSGECTVTRGATQETEFSDWIKKSVEGDIGSARKNATIVMMDSQQNPVKRYHMRNAWCSKVEISSLKAGDAAALTEQITITFEELVIE